MAQLSTHLNSYLYNISHITLNTLTYLFPRQLNRVLSTHHMGANLGHLLAEDAVTGCAFDVEAKEAQWRNVCGLEDKLRGGSGVSARDGHDWFGDGDKLGLHCIT